MRDITVSSDYSESGKQNFGNLVISSKVIGEELINCMSLYDGIVAEHTLNLNWRRK
mgnify:FL=1|jgi:hypothetical protein